MKGKQSYVGMTYMNGAANLTVIGEPIKNSIKCRCNICGAEETYKLSDLKDRKIQACKSCKQGIEIGDTVGGLRVTQYRLFNNKLALNMYCEKCNKNFIHNVELVKSKGYKCPVCAKQKLASSTANGSNNTAKKVEVRKKEKAKKNLLGSIVSFEKKPELDFSKYTIHGDFIFLGNTLKTSATGASVRTLEKAQCTHCGAITSETESWFRNHEYKCQKCNKINNERRNVIENTNWVGYVRHNIEVVKTKKNSSGVLVADTRCLACGHEMTIPVVTIMSEPELTCIKCGDTPITVECPVCHKNHIKTTLRRLYERKDKDGTISFLCGKDTVPMSEVVLQHETATRLDNIRKRYKGYTLLERIPGHDETPSIFKFKEGYTGTDGKEYHTCMCETHNKLMVLNDDEILNYKHEYCGDTRMMPYKPKSKRKE